MKVDLVRAALLYPVALAGHEAFIAIAKEQPLNTHVIIAAGVVLAAAIFELPRRIRKVVRTEYLFIVASERILLDAVGQRGSDDHPDDLTQLTNPENSRGAGGR
jgi:hypothetical protein